MRNLRCRMHRAQGEAELAASLHVMTAQQAKSGDRRSRTTTIKMVAAIPVRLALGERKAGLDSGTAWATSVVERCRRSIGAVASPSMPISAASATTAPGKTAERVIRSGQNVMIAPTGSQNRNMPRRECRRPPLLCHEARSRFSGFSRNETTSLINRAPSAPSTTR